MSVKAGRRADGSVDRGSPRHPPVEDCILVGALTHLTCALDLSLLVINR